MPNLRINHFVLPRSSHPTFFQFVTVRQRNLRSERKRGHRTGCAMVITTIFMFVLSSFHMLSHSLGCRPSGRWDKRRMNLSREKRRKADEWQTTWSISITHEREKINLQPGFHEWKWSNLMRLPTGLIILLRSSFLSCWVLDDPDGPRLPAATYEKWLFLGIMRGFF